jgi:hypothetical protein
VAQVVVVMDLLVVMQLQLLQQILEVEVEVLGVGQVMVLQGRGDQA